MEKVTDDTHVEASVGPDVNGSTSQHIKLKI